MSVMNQYIYHPAAGRGVADYGWLQANYSFSFSRYYNPDMMGFGLLRVLNDDTIAWGAWFPPHGHENMEIITIPQTGSLEHQDNAWWHGVISTGDVQVMSAWRWVEHSEYNASATEPATLFQLWIETKDRDIQPRYDQKSFGTIPVDTLRLLVSNDGRDDSLMIHQDAFISRASVTIGNVVEYKHRIAGNGVYILVVSGEVIVWGQLLWTKDAMGVIGDEKISIHPQKESDVLIIEVPMV